MTINPHGVEAEVERQSYKPKQIIELRVNGVGDVACHGEFEFAVNVALREYNRNAPKEDHVEPVSQRRDVTNEVVEAAIEGALIKIFEWSDDATSMWDLNVSSCEFYSKQQFRSVDMDALEPQSE